MRHVSRLFLAALVCLGVVLSASAQTQQWAARYHGPGNSSDVATAMALDGAGNVYVTGKSAGAGTGLDYATLAYDPSGNQLLLARYDGPSHGPDIPVGIAVDPGTGNVYVTGTSESKYATVAYDSSGNQLWVAQYNGLGFGSQFATAIALDSAGNIYVTGYSSGTGFNSYDYATVAYDPSGNQLWVARYSGPVMATNFATAIALDGAGNVYVTGYSYGGASNYDYATLAYDSNGNQLWEARYNGPGNGNDQANAIAIDGSTGNVYVTGFSRGAGAAQPDDYATVAYDSSGNQLWVSRYNFTGNSADVANAIAVDGAGNVIVTGKSYGGGVGYEYGTVAYDSSGNQLWVGRYHGQFTVSEAKAIAVDAAGNVYVTGWSDQLFEGFDYATLAYSSFGSQLWVALYNGPANGADGANAIKVDGAGNVYVTGSSERQSFLTDFATVKYSQP